MMRDDAGDPPFAEGFEDAAVLDPPAKSGAAHRRRRASGVADVLPVRFALPADRATSIALKSTAAIGLTLLAGFFLRELPRTPGLTGSMLVVILVGFIAAGVLLVSAMRDAVGRLVLDARGIDLGPRPFGVQVAWSNVVGWQMSFDDEYPNQLVLHTAEAFPVLLDVGRLSRDEHRALRKELRRRLGEEKA